MTKLKKTGLAIVATSMLVVSTPAFAGTISDGWREFRGNIRTFFVPRSNAGNIRTF